MDGVGMPKPGVFENVVEDRERDVKSGEETRMEEES